MRIYIQRSGLNQRDNKRNFGTAQNGRKKVQENGINRRVVGLTEGQVCDKINNITQSDTADDRIHSDGKRCSERRYIWHRKETTAN